VVTDTKYMAATQTAEFTFWATYRLLGGRSFPRTYQANITVPITAGVDEIRQAISAKTGYPVKRIQYSVNP
jgi:hypothetical protein